MNPEVPEGYSPSAVRVAWEIARVARTVPGISWDGRDPIGFIEEDNLVEVYLTADLPPRPPSLDDELVSGLIRELEGLGFRTRPSWHDGYNAEGSLWHEAWAPSWSNSTLLVHDQGPSDNLPGRRSWVIDIVLANADAVTGISGIDRSPWVLVERWIEHNVRSTPPRRPRR